MMITVGGAFGLLANLLSMVSACKNGALWLSKRRKMQANSHRVEAYLKEEKEKKVDKGQRTIKHLISKLNISEGDINTVAIENKRIKISHRLDKGGQRDVALFEYNDDI